MEHGLEPGISRRKVYTFNDRHRVDVPCYHLSLACNHCDDAICMTYCPGSAIYRDEQSGLVQVDPDACLGCRYCIWVCPYEAPYYNEHSGIVDKCDFCRDIPLHDKAPACVKACPTFALQVEERPVKTAKKTVPGFPDIGIKPAIHLDEHRDEYRAPEMFISQADSSGHFLSSLDKAFPDPKRRIRTEWTLALFTFLYTVSVSLASAMSLSLTAISVMTFLGAGFLGAGLSVLHLGKKARLFRSIINWRKAWISREILFVSTFIGLATAAVFIFPSFPRILWAAIVAGWAGLVSIDMIYSVVPQINQRRLHSAQTVLNGLIITSLLSRIPIIFTLAIGIKVVLYVSRKYQLGRHSVPYRPALSILQLVFGILLPILVWIIDLNGFFVYAVAGILAGFLLDRLEFYLEFDPITPARQMTKDLNKFSSFTNDQSTAPNNSLKPEGEIP